jgi:ankyrin repeat protein
MAVVHGCSSTVEILLAHGADPGLGDKFGAHLAAVLGAVEDWVTCPMVAGVTALHLAARSGCGMEAMLNFTHNHSPEIQDSKETPLHVAAEVGNIEAIQVRR